MRPRDIRLLVATGLVVLGISSARMAWAAACTSTQLNNGCYDKNNYATRPGYIYPVNQGDLQFWDPIPGDLLSTLQNSWFNPNGARAHSSICESSSSGNCTRMVNTRADFSVSAFVDKVDKCAGKLSPNACSVLQNLGPGVSYRYQNDTRGGYAFSAKTATDQAAFASKAVNYTSDVAAGYPYQVGGFTDFIHHSQCSEYLADHMGLTYDEGYRQYIAPYDTVFNLANTTVGLIYNACMGTAPSPSFFMELLSAIFCGNMGPSQACMNIANQVVNSFLNRCGADTQAYSNGYYDPHTTVHRIGDDAYPYPTGPQTDVMGGYLLANTGVSGTDPMYQKLAGYTYGYYLDHNCSLPGGCYFGGSYGAYTGPNAASRFDGGRRFTGVAPVTYVSSVTCTCPDACLRLPCKL